MTRPVPLSLCAVALLSACAAAPQRAVDALPLDATGRAVALAEVKDDLDRADPPAMRHAAAAAPAPVPVADAEPLIRGLGYGQVSGQPGKTQNEKRLMAIRAARVDALRDLTEQVHGVRINAETTVRDMVTRDDSMLAIVQGTLRGARTLRVTPTSPDSFEVEMAIDRSTLHYIVRALGGQS